MLIPGGGGANANGYSESEMKSNPIQALSSMAAKMRPDLEIASIDGARQTVTLKDKSGALSTFKFDPQTKALARVAAVQPRVAEIQPPPPAEQPASPPLRWTPDWMPDSVPTTQPPKSSPTPVVTAEGDKETIATFKSSDKAHRNRSVLPDKAAGKWIPKSKSLRAARAGWHDSDPGC